jgi:RTX calcium-binding nonapeptide repeat (4 copies)
VFDAALTDSSCEPVTFAGGDTTISDPPIVHPGETWTYMCERPLPPGSLVNRVVFTGISGRDGRPWPRTRELLAFCGRLPATIVGTERRDVIMGTPGDDVIILRGGEDSVRAGGGNDTVCGGDEQDVIRGGEGNDILRGEGAGDRLVGGPGTDTLIGGPGVDSLQQ